MLNGCDCGHVCLDSQTCERYQNPLSCKEYKNMRIQNRMKALDHRGQKRLFAGSLAQQ